MILEKEINRFADFTTETYVTFRQLIALIEKRDQFKNDLLSIFNIDENVSGVIKVGNSKFLLDSISHLDSQNEKIDIDCKIRDVQLYKMLEDEKATFEIFNITEGSILTENRSDLLLVESAYSAKNDILDIYSLSKFANYCRDKEFDDLVNEIKNYLKVKNKDNNDEFKLRLIFKKDEKKYFVRAVTSTAGYKDFGINFSVFVALMTLSNYVENSQNEIYIDNYVVDDSRLYISFSLSNEFIVDDKTNLTFNLILENDEIKRNAVSFNGAFKLKHKYNDRFSEIYLKPKGLKKSGIHHPVDLLTYAHRGSVKKVIEDIKELPNLIDHFIEQVKQDSHKIVNIGNQEDVKKFIMNKIKYSKKAEFKKYKDPIRRKLMSITVDNTFKLFELLREVEELFEHDDIISRDFWRSKLYESLIEKE